MNKLRKDLYQLHLKDRKKAGALVNNIAEFLACPFYVFILLYFYTMLLIQTPDFVHPAYRRLR